MKVFATGAKTPETGGREVRHGLLALLMAMLIGLALAAATSRHGQAQELNADEPIASQGAVIRFLVTDDYPPFNSLDEENVLTGLNVDLARAICLDLVTTCDIQARPWESLLGDVAAGRADAAIAAHRVTADALRKVAFTDRYFYTPARFATHRDMRIIPATPTGMDGLNVGVVTASPHEAYLTQFFRNTRVKGFNTPELAQLALQNRQIDAVFGDGINLAFWANGSLSKNCCRMLEGAYFEAAFFGDGLGIAVNPKDRELLGQLNSALRRVKASGRLNELVERYFPIKVY